ncbi:hypothetical protein ACE38W_17450 [Chitinophaga sp. Hz27]|uniref:hypothetical protein n=1 Tax=Chitinophaga sp. Hz27 TaxID=3347169 RepID=UPI0035DD8471
MLSSISWACYLLVAALLLAVYYLYVIARYYRREVRNFINGKSPAKPLENESTSPGQLSLFDTPEIPIVKERAIDPFSLAIDLSSRIKMVVEVAKEEKYSKAGLVAILRKLIAEYPELNVPAFQVAINNVILSECKRLGSDSLSENEVKMLW